MDFAEVLRRRRMVRNYTGEPVDPAAVDRVVEAARRAPSAGFTQGAYLLVVTERDTRSAIAGLAGEEGYVARGFDPWMSSAPVHVVVCVSERDYRDRYREPDKRGADDAEVEWPIPYWWVDAGAVLMLLLLAAVDEGLGAGFFGFHRLAGLNELLGIPEHVSPIGVVTLGHPAPDRRSGSVARGRRPRSEVVRRERW